jgi:hypothetical protein
MPLEHLHRRLADHFAALRDTRTHHSANTPVFALEHGLSRGEIDELEALVRESIASGHIPRKSWLPLVVYAAEVGYAYSGDEYWQTFASETPGWVRYGDRQLIRTRFQRFAEEFRGARPQGAWARHFSIIAWPISHAVLPRDLQRQLAHLLYEFRRSLNSALLEDPGALGQALAARAWHASDRFRIFAENTELLGRVSTALLLGEEHPDGLLLPATLSRLATDLSAEHASRTWLRGARSRASEVLARGFVQGGASSGLSPGGGRVPLPAAADPRLELRREAHGWRATLELPDFSALGLRLNELARELRVARATVQGVSGAPLARGRLLYGGQTLSLDEWPDLRAPLVSIVGGTSGINALLADQSVFPPGPPWVFKVNERGAAREIRSKHVRTGEQYVVVTPSAPVGYPPSWISEAPMVTAGFPAYRVDVPSPVAHSDIEAIESLGLGVVADVEIRPAGVVPADWDREGRATWLEGEVPIVGLASSLEIRQATITVDDASAVMSWPQSGDLFVALGELSAGTHRLGVVLHGETGVVADETAQILVRQPHVAVDSGSQREGLRLLTSPVAPTLDELWDGLADIEVVGPDGLKAQLCFALSKRGGAQLASHCFEITLPVDANRWRARFNGELAKRKQMLDCYDDAEACGVTVSHRDLGRVTLRAERAFVPMRWARGADKAGSFARLVDHTADGPPQISTFSFAKPDRPVSATFDTHGLIRLPEGGLVLAATSNNAASVILTRQVHDFRDLGLKVECAPVLKSPTAIASLLNCAHHWRRAAVSPKNAAIDNHFRGQVLARIAMELAVVICGGSWSFVERSIESGRKLPMTKIQKAVGEARYQRAIASELLAEGSALSDSTPEALAEMFSQVVGRHYGVTLASSDASGAGLGEFVLRMATDPGSVRHPDDTDFDAKLKLVLESPVLLRSARFFALMRRSATEPDRDGLLGTWTWA